MRILLIIYIIFLPKLIQSQELSFDNSLTSIISNSNSTQVVLTFTGENKFVIRNWTFSSNTNYILSYAPKLSENELNQRWNSEWKKEKNFIFFQHQFNYSYVREINSENSTGVGYGRILKKGDSKYSLSYGLIFQKLVSSDNEGNLSQIFIRHSLRFKFNLEKKNWQVISEYYWQPDILDSKNFILFGSTKIVLFPEKKLNFIIQDILNFRSLSDVKTINNLTIGIGYKLNKKFDK